MTTTPLRGREHEIRVLSAVVEDAVRGEGGVLVVEGEAGIGKTRLVAEAIDVAGRAGLVVASGAADALDGLAPMASLLTALRASTKPLLPANVFDGLAASSDQRVAVLDRLGASLEERARESPLLIVLDDVQWADSATLLALRVLTLQLASYPVVWLLARRPHPSSVALERTLDQLEMRGARRISLTSLDRDAVTAIVDDLLDARPDESLLTLLDGASGNPFYVLQLVHATRRDGGLAFDGKRVALVDPHIPAAFQDAVTTQLGSLSDPARELLQFGSLFGRRFRVRDVAELLAHPPARFARPVAEAIAAELVVEDGNDLMFRHDLLRQGVYENIPASLREALHLDIARGMLSRGVSPADAARHLVFAARRGDTQTLALLQRASDELIPTAPAAAADLKLRVLELMDRGTPEWAQATSDTMRLLSVTGRSRQAEALGLHARDTSLDPAANAVIQLGLAHAFQTLGLYRLVPTITRALLATPDLPDDTRLAAVSVTAASMVRGGDDDAERMVEAELELATRLDDVERLINNLGNRSHLAARTGDLDRAFALVTEERALAERSDPARSTARAPRLGLAFNLLLLDRTEEARAELTIAEREAREVGYPWAVMFCEQSWATTLLIDGQLDEAAAIAEAALEDARAVDLEARTPDLLHVLAQVAIRRGELGLARRHVDRISALLDEGAGLVGTVRDTAGGRLAFAEGDPERALRLLEPVYQRPYLTTLLRNDTPLAPELVRIARAAGTRGIAVRMVEVARGYADQNPSVASLCAQAAHAAGLLDDDVALLRDASEHYARSPRLLARAVVAEDLAHALVRHDEYEEGVALLKAAFAQYGVLGARRDADRTRARLRDLGVRVRAASAAQRPPSGWDALTPAEQHVARLAGEALTNRQIAERLYLSPHTVTTHLRHIFTKLGIRSRVELARLVAS